MSPELLQRLVERGIAALPPDRLAETAEECWSRCVATGDGRFCVLWRLLMMIAGWFGEGDQGSLVSVSFLEQIDALMAREVPGIISAEDAETGCAVAHALHESLVAEAQLAGL